MSAFANKVVLITGAGSGIGRQFARSLAREGARIAAVDVNAAGLEELAKELAGSPVAWGAVDVTDYPALQAAVANLEQQLGPTDLLIAAAGIGRETHALDFTPADMEAVIKVNLIGVAHSFAAVLPGMRQRRQGHLVALSSLASYRGLPRMAAYCASKAGVNALCDSFRVELKPLGIAVTTICPGFIRTPMTCNLKLKVQPPMLELEDAVGRMIEGIRKRRPFLALACNRLWLIRLLHYLPRPISDWLCYREYVRNLQE
jgi:NAD(P)-dependent dehydrogenase (short-subunit alcohol dehydrogenase family)